jgi:hypothetical protein
MMSDRELAMMLVSVKRPEARYFSSSPCKDNTNIYKEQSSIPVRTSHIIFYNLIISLIIPPHNEMLQKR